MKDVTMHPQSRLLGLLAAIAAALALILPGCGSPAKAAEPDFADAAAIEAALNAGEDVAGKTVEFSADELVPNSAFGYNLQAGEHLNFVSTENPGVGAGDAVTVRVTKVESMLGSWIISYERV